MSAAVDVAMTPATGTEGEKVAMTVPPRDPAAIEASWEVPTSDEAVLPPELDGEGWLELLRDGYHRQIREENEFKEPAPLPRAMLFSVPPGQPIPERKYPRTSLDFQRQVLNKFRPEPPPPMKGGMMMMKGGCCFKGKGMMPMMGMGCGGCGMPGCGGCGMGGPFGMGGCGMPGCGKGMVMPGGMMGGCGKGMMPGKGMGMWPGQW
eukprot:TRINITY_DN6984_c0_g1_i2.p1 TRINITY_DN6984_c0_g1~~TRINITY_DN6984_c0_g1_i2.p1  ORF type:complete len:234 (+),score=53.38 TRINITY_DN6984_c0_g1_i2:85-702(+)